MFKCLITYCQLFCDHAYWPAHPIHLHSSSTGCVVTMELADKLTTVDRYIQVYRRNTEAG